MWGAALISTVLGTQLPGPGSIYLGQTLRFRKPVAVGDRISTSVNLSAKDWLVLNKGILSRLSEGIMNRLDQILPGQWSKANPVDIIGDAPPERYLETIKVPGYFAQVRRGGVALNLEFDL